MGLPMVDYHKYNPNVNVSRKEDESDQIVTPLHRGKGKYR